MEDISDRVYEAYHNKMGETFGRQTRDRINWICSKVEGTTIMDVGCSQGITSILLGREGKKVDGIDVDETSIAFANNMLSKESESTRSNVYFRVGDFQSIEFVENGYDTVILSELLEHLIYPFILLEKAKRIVKDGGKIIISIPLGINDSIDHKQTFFGPTLLKELYSRFQVLEIHTIDYFWLGFVCEKRTQEKLSKLGSLEYDKQMNFIEGCLYEKERRYLDERNELRSRINEINSKSQQQSISLDAIKMELIANKEAINSSLFKINNINDKNAHVSELFP